MTDPAPGFDPNAPVTTTTTTTPVIPPPLPAPVVNTVSDLSGLVSTIEAATTADWASPSFIEGLALKALAVVSIWHPGFHLTAAWQGYVTVASVAAVAAEQSVRSYLKHKSLSAALAAAGASVKANAS